jgi:hypothetical protein
MSSQGNVLKLSDIVEPDAALRAAIDLYGVDATTAVAHCALTAHYDGREADYRFWCVVFRRLKENEEAPKAGAESPPLRKQ